MKLLTIVLLSVFDLGVASSTLARDYSDLVAEGYRWVTVDGPYACPTKEDLRQITSNPSDSNKLHMVEQLRAYFRGLFVRLVFGAKLSLPLRSS